MTGKTIMDCERRNLEKFKKMQLPNYFKRIGIAILVISLVTIFFNKFFIDLNEIRTASRYGILVGLLIISISKEKIEDELSAQLRMQSYSIAFITAVAYTLTLPLVSFLIHVVFNSGEAAAKDLGDFYILWILLFVQVFYFEMLKRMHK